MDENNIKHIIIDSNNVEHSFLSNNTILWCLTADELLEQSLVIEFHMLFHITSFNSRTSSVGEIIFEFSNDGINWNRYYDERLQTHVSLINNFFIQ